MSVRRDRKIERERVVVVEFCVRTKFLGGKIIISMGKSVFNF